MNKHTNRYIFGSISIVIIAIGIFLYVKKDTPTALSVKEGGIAVFGDSLVSGVGATSGNDLPSQLSSTLGIPVYNAGKAGDTTQDALNRINEVLVQDPSIVVLIIGGNDYLRRIPKETTLSNVNTIIDELQRNNIAVVLVGVSRLVYNSDYKKIAEEKNTLFVPHVLDLTRGKSDLMSDPIHPNDAGYALIAEKITPEIMKLLKI